MHIRFEDQNEKVPLFGGLKVMQSIYTWSPYGCVYCVRIVGRKIATEIALKWTTFQKKKFKINVTGPVGGW